MRLRIAAILVVLATAAPSSRATIVNYDGDFGFQALDTAVAFPWGPVDGLTTATAAAQSPYTNVYADNGLGAQFAPQSGWRYIVGLFEPKNASTAPELHYSIDFRIDEATGAFQRFEIGRDSGASDAVTFFVSDTSLYVCNGGQSGGWAGGTFDLVTVGLSPSTWYNVQLDLDLVGRSYSGRISTPTEAFAIRTRAMIDSWDGTINCVFTDDDGPGTVSYAVDNFAVSDAPLTPIGPEPIDPDLPSLIGAYINIDFNGVRDGDEFEPVTFQGPNRVGGGAVYNGLLVDSRGGNDNVTVAGAGLLDSEGNATPVSFSASPVGGDTATVPTDPTDPTALTGDYLFTHSAENISDAPFTISGLGNVDSVQLLVSGSGLDQIVIDGALPAGDVFYNVPVVDGTVTGTFGNGSTCVVYGMTIVLPEGWAPLPGDANGDGVVDDKDASLLGANWLSTTAGWAEGDFNGDHAVNDADAAILAAHWGQPAEGGPDVPEPSAAALLIAGGAVLVWRRRRNVLG